MKFSGFYSEDLQLTSRQLFVTAAQGVIKEVTRSMCSLRLPVDGAPYHVIEITGNVRRRAASSGERK